MRVNPVQLILSAQNTPPDSRATSRVIGFALLLGVILSTVFISFALSLSPLTSFGGAVATDTNVEGTVAVTEGLTQISSGTAEQVQITPDWSNAEITTQGSTTVSISTTAFGGIDQTHTTQAFVVTETDSQTTVRSEAGHVFVTSEGNEDGATKVSPQLSISEGEALVNIPVITGTTGTESIATGGTSARIIGLAKPSPGGTVFATTRSEDTAEPVEMRIDTDYPQAWERVLTNTNGIGSVSQSGETVTARFTTRRLSVTITEITVRF